MHLIFGLAARGYAIVKMVVVAVAVVVVVLAQSSRRLRA